MKYFTKAQIEEIRKQLATLGVRDTDLPDVDILSGDELIAIVQDGMNKKVGIKDFFIAYLPEDFVKKLVQGESAYQIACRYGYHGTEEEWLASLKGENGVNGLKGDTGDTGETGPRGPQGPAGVTSVKATIDGNKGTPRVDVSLNGTQLNLDFHNLKGEDGTGDGGGYVLPQATSSQLGGIRVGYEGTTANTYAVVLDGDGNAYVYVPLDSARIGVATSENLGGIKIGFTDNNPQNKNYPVQLYNQRAYVHVPWTGGTGSGDGGSGGGYWESAFAAYAEDDVPSVMDIPDLIIDSNDDAEWSGVGSGSSGSSSSDDGDYGTWHHYAPNNINGELVIWMAIRWVDSNGTPEDWQGPWRISGPGGENGLDGDNLEFIYTRTNIEDATLVPPLTNTNPDTSSTGQIPDDDDFVPQGWKDNAMDASIQIDPTHRVMWMAFRIKVHTNAHPEGQWSSFVGPIAWSIYGKQGIDGDGVEYIFYANTTAPTENPHTWNKNTTGANGTWEQREFVKQGFDSVWKDDPIDLDDDNIQPGTKQWVCIRRRYADTASNRSSYTTSTDITQPYWHAFSQPALWSYKAKDGDAGTGIVADFDNEMMAVPLEASGDCKRFTQEANVYLYNGASTMPCTVTLQSITDTDAPVTTYNNQTSFNGGSGYCVTISGNKITVNLWAGDVNLSGKSLLIKVRCTSTADSSVYRDAILSLVGIHFGENGGSFKLGTSSRVIRHSEGIINPTQIDVTCIHVDGLSEIATYTPASSSISVLNGLVEKNFFFKYEIDDSGTLVDLNSTYISTSSIQDNLRIMLYYGDSASNMSSLLLVDQETIFVISDGVDPQGKFKSVVFKRSGSQPTTPDTGVDPTGSDDADSRGITNSYYGGTFEDPIPYGWSDGIPAYDSTKSDNDNSVWMTSRIFIENPTSSQQTTWSTPARAANSTDYDIEFALAQPGGGMPPVPADPVNGSGGNRHGCNPSSYQVWFDPEYDKYTSGTNRRDFSAMVWRAERFTRNGIAEDWVITRIKGENGLNGRGIASMVTTYGISASPTTIPSSWYNAMTDIEPEPGDWVWAKTVVTYDDTPASTDTFYTKYRQVSNGADGTFTAVPFRGVYQDNVDYYGNSARTDIVYFRDSGRYYRANPLYDGVFSGHDPATRVNGEWVTDNTYWLDFGENYDSLATGLAFIEDLVVMKLNTAGEGAGATDARIVAQGNDLVVYDSNGLSKVHITADDLDFVNQGYYYPISFDVEIEGQKHTGLNTSGRDSLRIDLSSFVISGVGTGSSVYVNVPSFVVNFAPGTYGSASLTVANIACGIYDSNGFKVETITGTTTSIASTGGKVFTSNSSSILIGINGSYTVSVIVTYDWSIGAQYGEVLPRLESDSSNTGSVWVNNDTVNSVDIGKNGMIARLGNGFSFQASSVSSTRVIKMMGVKSSTGNACGIMISENGVQILRGSGANGTTWVDL